MDNDRDIALYSLMDIGWTMLQCLIMVTDHISRYRRHYAVTLLTLCGLVDNIYIFTANCGNVTP